VQETALKLMAAKNIRVAFHHRLVKCKPASPHFDDKGMLRGCALVTDTDLEVPFDECFWCTQAQAQSWLKETELETTVEGFIAVSPTLESNNVKDVFACGDVAHLTQTPRPKAGVFAVRAGYVCDSACRRRRSC
jgi:NADH dehydrogenase FAD-containing subunit